MVVVAEVDLSPVDRAGEAPVRPLVVLEDGHACVETDVQPFVEGEVQRVGALDRAAAGPLAVDVERDVAAAADASARVGELGADLVGARRYGRVGGDRRSEQSAVVVVVGEPARADEERPASGTPALGDQRAVDRLPVVDVGSRP
jgi:hypothetical protein